MGARRQGLQGPQGAHCPSTGQGTAVLQMRVLVMSPAQAAPPWRGAGRSHDRRSRAWPRPQVTEQALAGPQGPQAPATGQGARPAQARSSRAAPKQGFPGGCWEGAGAEHARVRVSMGSGAPLRQEPEQGPQGPQEAQAPCVGQAIRVSQALDSSASPGQRPPHLGSGRLHRRCRFWVPVKQETEQGPQGAHSDQAPGSGQHCSSSHARSSQSRVRGSAPPVQRPSWPTQRRCRSCDPSEQETEQGAQGDHGDHRGGPHARQGPPPRARKA